MEKSLSGYKYLLILALLYMTVKLVTDVLIYKIVSIGFIVASASALIMPLWFFVGDVITEVYGYSIAKHLIWVALICQFIFAFTCYGFIHLPSPAGFPNQAAYIKLLGNLPKVATASFTAIFLGAFINVRLISKWKILLRGQYFWLRSLGATAIGELIFTITAYVIEFLGSIPLSKMAELIIVSYSIKLLINTIAVIPSSLIAGMLKRLESNNANLPTVDYDVPEAI